MKHRVGLALLATAWCLGCSLEAFPDLISGHGADAGATDAGIDAGPADASVDAGPPLSCDAGLADCDGDRLSCETVLATDDSHCARCGRDCFGGGCSNGACGAVLLAYDDAGAGGIDLADGVPVWVNGRAELRTPGAAGGTTVASTAQRPLSLVARGGAVAWSTQTGTVEYLPALGGVVRQLATGRDITWGYLAMDDAFVYWPVVDAGLVERAPRDGGAVSVYARLPGAHSVTIGSAILFSGATGVYALRADGGLNPVSTMVVEPTHLALGGGFAWVCETSSDRVSRIELATGTRVTVDGQAGVHGIAADETGAFWASSSQLMFWPVDGGAPAEYAPFPRVHRIALTPAAIYWTEFEGAVRMQTR